MQLSLWTYEAYFNNPVITLSNNIADYDKTFAELRLGITGIGFGK